jgi:4-aminobutyrate aminotransferase-like enzyme/Ser/Thr protein kinase RdoA (MazF antagonist)
MPAATTDALAELLEREYGLTGSLTRLPGEALNYRLAAADGRRFVVKVMDPATSADALDLEFQIVERARQAALPLHLPRFVTTITGHASAAWPAAGAGTRARVLAFVPGVAWCDRPGAPAGAARPLLRHLGDVLGALDTAMDGFDHPAARRTHRWDLAAASCHRCLIPLVPDPVRRRTLEWAFQQYAAAAPRLAALPHGVIHGDANDENVLVDGARVSGLIDFGDSLWNPVVCELAVALAYAMLDERDPLDTGAEVVAGYHARRPLSVDELAALLPLVLGRLSVTVATAAERRGIDPDHPHWFVTEARAWSLLERLGAIDPADAGTRLAAATGIDPHASRGPSVAALLDRRRRVLAPSLSVAYREPLAIVQGQGAYLFDDRGRAFLDLVNNVCHVGHAHPRVVEAGQRQMARLNTNTRYLHELVVTYAERLTAMLPAPLDTCLFVNSGTEANELALRLAMAHTGRRDLLVVDAGYHGHTSRLIAASPYKFLGPGGTARPEPWVHVAPLPDGFRGARRGTGRATGEAYGDDVGRVIAGASGPPAAFLAESLPSCGGQVIPPPGWLETAFRHVRAAGGVCIADEVQVGFGRVGTHFWAFQAQGVVPDIVVLGKPVGNGHPIGAVVTTRAIAASFATGMEFFSTFGGNPVSCAIGLAVLDVIRDEGLQAHAHDVGAHFLAGLRELMSRHLIIGDVRGLGLFIGVELVRDRATLEPATPEADDLVNRLQRRGILLSTDGPHHNVLKIKPPMVISRDDIDMTLRALDDELRATTGPTGPTGTSGPRNLHSRRLL